MKRGRKNYFALCLLGLAFCMLQLHIMAGCCFVHHCHAGTISHGESTANEIAPVEITYGVVSPFGCEDLNGGRSVWCHASETSHLCDHFPNESEEEKDLCVITLLSDVSKHQVKAAQLFLSFPLFDFENISPLVRANKYFASDCFSVLLSESPFYLRYRSFLI